MPSPRPRSLLAACAAALLAAFPARSEEQIRLGAVPDRYGIPFVASGWRSDLLPYPQVKAFSEKYRAGRGATPQWYQACAYEAARAVFAAIRKAGSRTGPPVAPVPKG